MSIELRWLRRPVDLRGTGDLVPLEGLLPGRLQWREVQPREHAFVRVLQDWTDVLIVDEPEAPIEGRGEQRRSGQPVGKFVVHRGQQGRGTER